MTYRYIALIPAYEPDRKLLEVIADLGKLGFDIVLVDDGSGPEYSEVFEEAAERLPGKSGRGVILLIHNENMGKGDAIKTGLDFINNFMVIRGEESNNVVVTVDADGQHLARDVYKAARRAGCEPGTLVLGSRWIDTVQDDTIPQLQPDTAVPLKSRFGNTVTRSVFRLATGTTIHDTQTGLRAFTADLIPDLLSISGDRYEYEINMLTDCIARGIKVEEIPINTVYHNGNKGSHFDTVRDSYRIYREIFRHMTSNDASILGKMWQALRFSASSLCSFLIDYALYALLLFAGAGLITANICARCISSAVNYTINRNLVFRSGRSIAASSVQYFALAACILLGNTFVLSTLTGSFGMNFMLAKILTEILFFLISWTVQKYVIFYKEADKTADDWEKSRSTPASAEPQGQFAWHTPVRPKKLRNVRRREECEARILTDNQKSNA